MSSPPPQVSVISYAGCMVLSVVGDPGHLEPHALCDLFVEEVDALKSAVTKKED